MNSIQQKQHETVNHKSGAEHAPMPHNDPQDDRYPGTFFRIPGVPQPGKTTWSLVK